MIIRGNRIGNSGNTKQNIDNNEMRGSVRNQMFSGLRKYANQDENNGKPIGLTNFDWIRLLCDNIPKYSLSELENMIPWEREVYVGLLAMHLKEKADKQRQQQ